MDDFRLAGEHVTLLDWLHVDEFPAPPFSGETARERERERPIYIPRVHSLMYISKKLAAKVVKYCILFFFCNIHPKFGQFGLCSAKEKPSILTR